MNPQKLERVRLLSSRFHELQGLRTAAAGAAIAIGMGAYLAAAPRPTNDGGLVALVVSFVLVAPALVWLQHYYNARFGRKVWKTGLFARLFLPVYLIAAFTLNTTFPSIPPGGPTVGTVALLSLWVAIRDWPWRAYYLIAPLACAAAFSITASGGGSLDPELTLPILFLATGLSFTIIGVLDHLILVRLVDEARQSESATIESI